MIRIGNKRSKKIQYILSRIDSMKKYQLVSELSDLGFSVTKVEFYRTKDLREIYKFLAKMLLEKES